jgi:feruloyl esterase
MKFTFSAFRILLAAVFFLFSFATTAQTTRYDDERNASGFSGRKLEILRQFAATKPSIFSMTATGTPQAPRPSAASCANMLSLNIPGTEVTSAQLIPADPGNGLPEYCDVLGFTQQTIGFDVRMPTIWNGKMYFAGNFVFAGRIPRGQTKKGLTRNYATVSTDTGHQDTDILDASWALNNREAEIDFGFRAVHVTTLLGKIIISTYYGGAPKFSYFDGCSTGGGQALREAELFPEDYDGYIAGAPVLDFTGNFLALNWKMQALHATPDSDLIPPEKLYVIGNAVLVKCDAIDGLRDGLIEDPRKCDFEPATLLCKNGDGPNCLTKSETQALQLIYQGPRTSFGVQLYPGLVKGGETPDGTGNGNGWEAMINTPGAPSFEFTIQDQFFRYLAFPVDNPNFDWSTFNFNTDPRRLDFMGDILNATSPNLSRFHKLGRKLLMYHGWSDATVSPLRTIEYYREVRNRLGKPETRDSIRLFMAPGMYHCSAGPGPDTFDRITALEQWVEQGVAPEEMEATHFDINGNPDRTRPLCAYPKVAHYSGSGSIDEAANFTCVVPLDDDTNDDKD